MKPFAGFPAGKTRFTPIPDLFYVELLPAMDDLAELKLALYMFYALNRQRGFPRYLTTAELAGEGALMGALREIAEPESDTLGLLRTSVDKAVDRGWLLRLTICDEDHETDYLFLNTPQGRKAVQDVKDGELVLETSGFVREAHIERERPSIYDLYEQNIGLLQPLIAEELQAAAASYPQDWIVEAFTIAAERNARNWRYIRAILERWASEGKDSGSRDGSATRSRRRPRRPDQR